MEPTKTIEELLEIHGEELKEYLLRLPLSERRSVIRELLEARQEMGEAQDEVHESARQ